MSSKSKQQKELIEIEAQMIELDSSSQTLQTQIDDLEKRLDPELDIEVAERVSLAREIRTKRQTRQDQQEAIAASKAVLMERAEVIKRQLRDMEVQKYIKAYVAKAAKLNAMALEYKEDLAGMLSKGAAIMTLRNELVVRKDYEDELKGQLPPVPAASHYSLPTNPDHLKSGKRILCPYIEDPE